jgi:hypothetical protein
MSKKPKAKHKWTPDFDMTSIPDKVFRSEWSRRASAKRETFGGGRPGNWKLARVAEMCSAPVIRANTSLDVPETSVPKPPSPTLQNCRSKQTT